MSGSRAALLGLLAGGVVLLIGYRPALRRYKWWIGSAALAIGGGCIFYFSPAGQAIRNRVNWVATEPLGGARPLLWRDSLVMSRHHLALGYGPETFLTEFPRQESLALARAFPDFLHESPHNIFLEALVSQGVTGVLILAALCIWGGFAARRSPVLGAALAGVVTAQLFTAFVLPTAFFFFLTLALLVEQGPLRRIPALRLASCTCAIILVFYAVRFFAADWALGDASRALDRGDLQNALAEYDRATKWAPSGSSADLYYSRRLANYARKTSDLQLKTRALQAAYATALNATRTSEERSNAWYNLAAFLSTTNSPADVERSLRESVATAPNWYKPHWILAQLYLAEHRLDDARIEAETAVRCNVKAPELLYTLENIRAAQRQ